MKRGGGEVVFAIEKDLIRREGRTGGGAVGGGGGRGDDGGLGGARNLDLVCTVDNQARHRWVVPTRGG